MNMKPFKLIALTALMALLCCCAPKQNHQRIEPLPAISLAADSLQDCTLPAVFASNSIDWEDSTLTVKFYNMDLYDAVEISLLQVGDTLLYRGEPMVVATIEERGEGLDINGGIDNGGCCLYGYEGGTYVAREYDDHAVYSPIGTLRVAIDPNCILVDCGEEPLDPSDTISSGLRQYLEGLEDYRQLFFQLNTVVTVEHGKVTAINRRWIP